MECLGQKGNEAFGVFVGKPWDKENLKDSVVVGGG
jgi:hypothetical protein